MTVFFVILSLIGFIAFGVLLVKRIIKNEEKRTCIIGTVCCFIIFILFTSACTENSKSTQTLNRQASASPTAAITDEPTVAPTVTVLPTKAAATQIPTAAPTVVQTIAPTTNPDSASVSTEASSSKSSSAQVNQNVVATDAPSESNSWSGTSSNVGDDGKVYVGKTGNKYHIKSCPTLKGKGIEISMNEAQAQHRQPCKVCHK